MDFLFRDSRIWLKGLVMACPFQSPLPECPLRDIRTLPVSERLKWANGVDKQRVGSIITHHKKCLETREKIHFLDGSV
jgi:hypothetical protein